MASSRAASQALLLVDADLRHGAAARDEDGLRPAVGLVEARTPISL
ncbi:hypothetical protein ACTWP5_03935 [Streptomyces sp. 4N509B]